MPVGASSTSSGKALRRTLRSGKATVGRRPPRKLSSMGLWKIANKVRRGKQALEPIYYRGKERWQERRLATRAFLPRSGPHHLATVVKEANGIAPELDVLLEGVAPLQTARPNEVSFLDNPRYASTLEQTLAGAVIVHPDMQARCRQQRCRSLRASHTKAGRGWLHCSIPCRRFPRYPPDSSCRRGCARRSLDGSRTVVCD